MFVIILRKWKLLARSTFTYLKHFRETFAMTLLMWTGIDLNVGNKACSVD
jgi:hypothetical protein